jgi:hypothetical protein
LRTFLDSQVHKQVGLAATRGGEVKVFPVAQASACGVWSDYD